jgi:LPS O-antigen subunit length determinant protein (WzzB/FepE family)
LGGARLEAELKLRQQVVLTLAMNREAALLDEKNDISIVNVLDNPNLPIEKTRPKRAIVTLTSFLLVVLGTWCWSNRKWIRSRLVLGDGSVA